MDPLRLFFPPNYLNLHILLARRRDSRFFFFHFVRHIINYNAKGSAPNLRRQEIMQDEKEIMGRFRNKSAGILLLLLSPFPASAKQSHCQADNDDNLVVVSVVTVFFCM